MPPPETNPFRDEIAQRTGSNAGNPFRAVLESRSQFKEPPSAGKVAREMAGRRLGDDLLAVPDSGGEFLANAMNFGSAVVQRAANAGGRNLQRIMPFIEPAPTTPSIGELYDQNTQREGVAQSALRAIPRPTFEDVTAGVKSIPSLMPFGESPGEAMARNRGEYQAQEREMREAHPVAAQVGDIGGDVLSLFVGRKGAGSGKFVRGVETRLAGRMAAHQAESLADDLTQILTGPKMQKLARGGVRSLEAGAEAAALDILKDPNADPTETAALAAGGQLVGSGFLASAQGLVSGGPLTAGTRIAVAAASTMGLLQLMKSATPGGRDRILESVESGYDKIALLLGVGAASALIGATRYGRGNAALSEQTRAFLDGLSTVHRGTTLSLLTDWTNGDDAEKGAIENVLTGLSKDAHFTGANDAERRIVSRLTLGNALEPSETGGGGGR